MTILLGPEYQLAEDEDEEIEASDNTEEIDGATTGDDEEEETTSRKYLSGDWFNNGEDYSSKIPTFTFPDIIGKEDDETSEPSSDEEETTQPDENNTDITANTEETTINILE